MFIVSNSFFQQLGIATSFDGFLYKTRQDALTAALEASRRTPGLKYFVCELKDTQKSSIESHEEVEASCTDEVKVTGDRTLIRPVANKLML